ncbi:unnamed protein product [Arabidopsis arenosa]|uniref:Cytochrome P450 n=1 Tax=Arabidopsis arenosa TaxID=38785 RepID=A0A8S2A8C2_ARAAE|nr:unnamed protein product [Arabidopsis arenosa]
MSFVWNVSICVTALVVVVISKWWYRWSNPKCNGKLPPGSMGFPIIGETIQFFKPYGFYEISPFIKKRMLRYGPLFRTNIFGSNTVVTTDPDVIYEVCRQENKSFVTGYPGKFTTLIGKDNPLTEQGNIHKHFKQITLQFFGSDGLKRTMIGDLNRATREDLRSKASQGKFNLKEAVENLIVTNITEKMITNLRPETKKNLIDSLKGFNLEWFQSFFTLSTWRSFYRLVAARKAGLQVISDVYLTRKESGENHGDFLSMILEDTLFNAKSAMDYILTLPFVAKDTTSTVTCLAVKFIAENPKVLSKLKREHEAIIQNREDKEFGISWEEYKHKIPFTNMVINERYTIPAGWIVAVAPSVIHYDPAIYENPLEFNPWRWEGKELVNSSKTFMVFGSGLRSCAGAEFAKLQLAIFLHHLVANYDFSMAHDCEVTRKPLVCFPNGVHINISHSPTK